ncbi:MAG: hypothetical protein PF517_10330 [Salinivirgaceae bacterium]|nr:hypothetical protein [Salinivirgaceae bacterium]
MEKLNQRKLIVDETDSKKECWLKYSIEALTPVQKVITEIYQETAIAMGQIIQSDLFEENILVEIKNIGGIANNTYINQDETADLLIVLKETNENKDQNELSKLKELIQLREFTKIVLRNKFPEALLDDSQPLAIKLSIPSKPCNFCYYFGYFLTNDDKASGDFPINNEIKLLNYQSRSLCTSNPIKMITEVQKKDRQTHGNTKNLIRILKSIKTDSIDPICLTGHQITCIIYAMDNFTLSKPSGQLLFLLLEVSLFLKKIVENPYVAPSLRNPDNNLLLEHSNLDSFRNGSKQLKQGVDDLVKKLIMEVDLYENIFEKAAAV